MQHQVRSDGCDHEASTSYHRLVCELFICGTQAVDFLLPERLPDWYRRRLELMLEFVADYTRPDEARAADRRRGQRALSPLDDYAQANFRNHLHLFDQAGIAFDAPTRSRAYPAGGYYVVRAGEFFAAIRCGETGMAGLGGHSHNDQLSFELSCGEQPLVVDPGAYLYTADPDARHLFRSTALHSTMEIDSAEQNELRRDFLFTLPDRTRSEARVWEASGDRALFEGRHHGYEVLDRPAVHTRRFELDARSATVRLRDVVTSDAPHSLAWSFPLAPCSVRLVSGGAVADFPAHYSKSSVRNRVQVTKLAFAATGCGCGRLSCRLAQKPPRHRRPE
jgi:hypothetical protein